MARSNPSLVALLGLLAVAGYQNRDRLGELLNGRTGGMTGTDGHHPDSAADGRFLGGLSDLFGRFVAPHQQAKVDSWVQRGPNAPLSSDELAEALDEDTIAELVAKTGLSRDELLSRLSATLPEAVDQATPDGQFPPVTMREPRPT